MPFPEFTPTVPSFIRTLAERHGDRTMMVLDDRRITYGEAERASADWARGLVAAGAGKGTRIGVWMPNGPDWVLAWLAAARIGAVVVPINTFYQAREVGWILKHSDVQILLTASRFLSHDYLERLESYAPALASSPRAIRLPKLPQLRSVLAWGGSQRPWTAPGPADLLSRAGSAEGADAELLARIEESVHPSDPMVVIYSSGSTADPKGAVHSQGAVIRHSFNLNHFRDLGHDDRIYSPMPFFWVGGFVFALVSAMHAGACMLCEEAFEPGATLDMLERERATIVAGWPHYAKAMAEHESFASRDLSSIRSGNLYPLLPEGVRPRDPELRSNSLGMTETCGPHTMDRMDHDLPEKLRGSFGHSVPGVEHKVVDPESGRTLAAGEFGEICVRGYNLMLGLHKTERQDTFDTEGFYHTGDGGVFDTEGVLFFRGRLGDLIKTGGANVTPREVEVVLEGMPGVKEAYVVGIPDADRGQLVVAAIVPEAGAEPTAETLGAGARRELSSYKVPRHFALLSHEALPFTDTGKIDKRRLAIFLEEHMRTGT